jgi:SAM-dependent methyltransferase
MTETLCNIFNINRSSNVLEVGCGSGALLYGIQLCSQAKVFGYDYSENLIAAAKTLIDGDFRVSEASMNPFRGEAFDFVLSHSVFQYFPTLDYAFQTVVSMSSTLKPGGKIALLDLNNAEMKDAYHSARRLASGNPAVYEAKYKDYPHQFYDKLEMKAFLESLGFHDLAFIQHPVAEYKNSIYRFNIIGTKKDTSF